METGGRRGVRGDVDNAYYVFFDMETDGFNGKTLYIHAVSDDYDCGFLNEEEFLKFILFVAKRKKKVIFVAHNGGDFDFVRLFPYLLKYFGKPKKIISIHGKLAYFEYKFKECKIAFKDSYLLIPVALAKFDKLFELNVSKEKIDNISNLSQTDFEKVKSYCRTDCIVLMQGFKRYQEYLNQIFQEKTNLQKTLTLPSVAFNYFKKVSKYKIPNIHSMLFKKAYTGGRTEIFRMWYNKKFYVYDVNSMYPFVMKNFVYPTGKLTISSPDISKEGFSIIRIYSQKYNYIPYLFYKDEITKKLYFPVYDTPETVIRTNVEVRRLKSLGYDFDVLKSYVSEESDYLFNFIEDMFELRKKLKEEGKIGLSEVLKLIMNSIYGKFGQNKKREVIWFGDDFSMNTKRCFKLANEYYFFNSSEKFMSSIFSNLAIASYITAYARNHLYDILLKSDKPLYTDTDASFSTVPLPEGNKLGELKLEAVGYNFVAIQPKVYAYLKEDTNNLVLKAKGFPKKLFTRVEVEHPDVIFAYLKKIGIKLDNPTKFKKMIYNLSKEKEPFQTEPTIKRLMSRYEKRIYTPSGETYPIPLSFIKGRKICRSSGLTESKIEKLETALNLLLSRG